MSAHFSSDAPVVRHDWQRDELLALFDLPLHPELLHRASALHRVHFDPAEVQVSTLLSVKTGGCPEDCAYCPQSVRHDAGVERETLLPPDPPPASSPSNPPVIKPPAPSSKMDARFSLPPTPRKWTSTRVMAACFPKSPRASTS